MSYDVEKLLNSNYCVVFGGDENERNQLEEEILKRDSSYKVEISEVFFPKKMGPFTIRVKDSIRTVLLKDKILKAKGESYIVKHAKSLEVEGWMDYFPRNINSFQKGKFSLILDVAHGKTKYLFHNEILKDPGPYYLMLLSWFHSLSEFTSNNGKFIWITNLPKDRLVSDMLEKEMESLCNVFELVDGKLIYRENFIEQEIEAIKYKQTVSEIKSVEVPKDPKERAEDMIGDFYDRKINVSDFDYYMKVLEEANEGEYFFEFGLMLEDAYEINEKEVYKELSEKCLAKAYELGYKDSLGLLEPRIERSKYSYLLYQSNTVNNLYSSYKEQLNSSNAENDFMAYAATQSKQKN